MIRMNDMDIERIKELYLEKDRNCAEATLIAMNEEYNLSLDENSIKLIGAFGGGMGCGKVCGALAASIAVIGRLEIEDRAHASESLKGHCAEFVSRFEAFAGGTDCVDVKKKCFVEGERCLKAVLGNAELLAGFIEEKNLA